MRSNSFSIHLVASVTILLANIKYWFSSITTSTYENCSNHVLAMNPLVSFWANQLKIFNFIIQSVMILMMNMFRTFNRSFKILFHNISMFLNIPISYTNSNVPLIVNCFTTFPIRMIFSTSSSFQGIRYFYSSFYRLWMTVWHRHTITQVATYVN